MNKTKVIYKKEARLFLTSHGLGRALAQHITDLQVCELIGIIFKQCFGGNRMRNRFNLFFMLAICFSTPIAFAQHNTPSYWKCDNKVGGSWVFGRAPSACDVKKFLDVDATKKTYGSLVFADASDAGEETRRYMTNLYSVIRDSAKYYIKKRKPTVSAAEITAWQEAMYAVAHQESFWTHFRMPAGVSSTQLKMMRGDAGHGHGIMQIDDRWHYTKILNGVGADFIDNLFYAMDIFYTSWLNAASAKCVSSPTNWTSRTRSAYSSYNGGDSKKCRWTNPKDAWAKNDVGFKAKFDSKSWLKYVTSTGKASPIDVACLAESGKNCPKPLEDRGDENIVLKMASGEICYKIGDDYSCVSDVRDRSCLRSIANLDPNVAVSSSEELAAIVGAHTLDRHSICGQYWPESLEVGENFVSLKNIFMRETPAGIEAGVLEKNKAVQVLDFEMRFENGEDRIYYKVAFGNTKGYIFGGTRSTHSEWVKATTLVPLEKWIFTAGDSIEIVNSVGINLRSEPGGNLLHLIPAAQKLVVMSRAVRLDENKIYYQVSHNGQTGFIYAGSTLPEMNLNSWVRAAKVVKTLALAPSQKHVTYLKECLGEACQDKNDYLIGGAAEANCEKTGLCQMKQDRYAVIQEKQYKNEAWTEVEIDRTGTRGWVRRSELNP
jgi:hypothetical protein